MTDKAEIRFLHNVVNGPNVDVFAGTEKLAFNLSYGELTGYLQVKSSDNKIIVKSGDTIVIQKRVAITDGQKYTVIIGGSLENLQIFIYEDRSGCSRNGYSYLRFIHSVYSAPSVDVYLNNVKVFTDIKYGQIHIVRYWKLG